MIDTVIHGDAGSTFLETTAVSADGMARPVSITATAAGVTLWTSGAYQYDGAGNIKSIGTDVYRYDGAGRLASSLEQGSSLTNNYVYDSFGNRLSMQASFCRYNPNGSERCFTTGGALPFSVLGTTNRFTSLTYDAVGNVVNDGHRVFTYDVLGMPQRVTVGGRDFRYLYTADDERIALVERVSAGGATHNRTTWTLRGFDNKLLRTYSEEPASGISWKKKTKSGEARPCWRTTRRPVSSTTSSITSARRASWPPPPAASSGPESSAPSAVEDRATAERCSSQVRNAIRRTSGRTRICPTTFMPDITRRLRGASYRSIQVKTKKPRCISHSVGTGMRTE